MDFDWDNGKDAANRAKHGVSLAMAARLDWEESTVVPDHRRDYGEERFRLGGLLEGRLHICIFTIREGRIRIISLRKANAREVRRHDKASE